MSAAKKLTMHEHVMTSPLARSQSIFGASDLELSTPAVRRAYPLRPKLLAILLLLWFIPRSTMALLDGTLCPDAVTYLRAAQTIEDAAGTRSLAPETFQVYPTFLMLLHHAGLPPETAGRWWGVICGTLLVLPLFGWLRRQFDDEVAAIACVLIGFHPKWIEWSQHLIRDPTFGLLVTCALYCAWRAVMELRLQWFVAAGLLTLAAAQTRFEGWFLLLTFACWTVHRFAKSPESRRKLAVGTLGFVGAFPLLLLAINILMGNAYGGWVLGANLHKINYLRHVPLVSELFPKPPAIVMPPVVATVPIATNAAPTVAPHLLGSGSPSVVNSPGMGEALAPFTFGQATWATTRALVRGFNPCYGALFLCGLVVGRRRWRQWDQQGVFYLFAAIVLAVWLHTWESKMTSSRYTLPLVLVASPFAAIGCLSVAEYLHKHRPARHRQAAPAWDYGGRQIYIAGVLALIAGIALCDTFVEYQSPYRNMRLLGSWIRGELGNDRIIAGTGPFCVAAYYAETNHYCDPRGPATVPQLIASHAPDVILLKRSSITDEQVNLWLKENPDQPYKLVASDVLPQSCGQEAAVLIRQMNMARHNLQSPR